MGQNQQIIRRVAKGSFASVGLLALVLSFQNCSGGLGSSTMSSNSSSSIGVTQVQMKMKVYDSAGVVVYDDSVPNSSLILKAGLDYTFVVSSANDVPSGAALNLGYTNLGLGLAVPASPQTMAFKFGTNVVKAGTFAPGLYKFQLQATAPGMVETAKSYNVSYTCANPTFTAGSLNASGLSVSGSSNLYSFNAANVVSTANGQAPYKCALDQTGSSILDTSFQSCSTVFSNVWSNYVDTRKLHVAVLDDCGIVQQIEVSKNLLYSVPTKGTKNPFVFGKTSGSVGTAIDTRVQDLSYLATNMGDPNNDVQSSSSASSFTIQGNHNYKLASSVNFGITISLVDIVNTVDPATGTGIVDVSNAKMSQLDYSTDESGGTLVPIKFKSVSCTLSNQGRAVVFMQGVPCTADDGSPGVKKMADIEIWGDYVCTNVANNFGSFSINPGSFDGIEHKSDKCIGGGGKTGGGITPINL